MSVISFKHVISFGRNDEESANFNVPVPRFIRDKFNQQTTTHAARCMGMGSLSGMVRQFGTLLLLLLVDILPNGLVASYTIAARRRDQQRRARGSSYYPSKFPFESTIVRSSVSSADVTSLDSRTSPTQSYSQSEPAIRKHFAKVKPAIWKHWLVPSWWDDARGVDETVVWDYQTGSGDALNAAAERLLQLVLPSGSIVPTSKVRNEMRIDVAESMQSFQEFCEQNKIEHGSFSARLVASRGTVGAKCPVWHVDQVPCRWIQALVGPGCEWVANKDAVQWDQFYLDGSDNNTHHNNDTKMEEALVSNACRNEQLVNRQRAIIRHAQEGEGVILMGGRRFGSGGGGGDGSHSDDDDVVAVHKSPEITAPWQGRVLLTLNVLRHHVHPS
jgi:Protein of unknown function (DUF1826)